uniref:WAT1-related protein n=1 Tax=Ananas comosus var. bracteatus TaxID=296719 RepID=A0A6V7QHT8_ANACO|nr:unnamed protein product [Ananas comosus var. bracteatus]
MIVFDKVSERVKLLTGVLALQLCLGGFHHFVGKLMRWEVLLVFFFIIAFSRITANQGFYLLGLFYLSPTYASAIQNTIPAITFAMAAAVRLEKVNINRRYGLAKVVGNSCYHRRSHHYKLSTRGLHCCNMISTLCCSIYSLFKPIMNWTLGCVYLLACCLAWSAWMVFQVPVLQKYPKRLSFLTLTCTFGLIQFMVIAAFAEDDFQRWKIHSGGELFTVLYAGVVASGIALSLQIWCIDRGGPLYTAIFQPVQTVAVAIMSAFILGDQFYSGGIIGSVLIVIGLYFVLWGKVRRKRPLTKRWKRT